MCRYRDLCRWGQVALSWYIYQVSYKLQQILNQLLCKDIQHRDYMDRWPCMTHNILLNCRDIFDRLLLNRDFVLNFQEVPLLDIVVVCTLLWKIYFYYSTFWWYIIISSLMLGCTSLLLLLLLLLNHCIMYLIHEKKYFWFYFSIYKYIIYNGCVWIKIAGDKIYGGKNTLFRG